MAVKFQFQFAGADFSRPSSPYRKMLRVGAPVLGTLIVGLAYWQYLHHLTHRHVRATVVAATAATKVVAPATVKPAAQTAAATVAADPTAEHSSSLKATASEDIAAVGSYLMNLVKAAPVASTPAVPSGSDVSPVAVERIITSAPNPTVARPFKVHTDQERLLMAGQMAFENVMEMANKYPDAYGFQAGEFLSDATLGAPMTVYTIDETDRVNYQTGQPVKPLLKPSKQWVFPVLMGDRVCCMVEVDQTGHEYLPGKGSKSLAMAWNKIIEKWPAEDGYHPLLVVNPEVPGYYFTVPELPVQNLTDTIEMFYFHPGTSPADVILASWR